MTQARQVRITVVVTLTLLFMTLSLVGGPRWILWLSAVAGFIAVALTPEACPSCHAGPRDLKPSMNPPPSPPDSENAS